LNTHKVNRKKFQIKIQEIINYHKLPLKTSTFYGLGEDCPPMPKFPEGSYLKGIKIEIDNDAHKKKENGDKDSDEVTPKPAKKNFNKNTYKKTYEANGNVDPDFKPKKKWPKKKKSPNKAPSKKVTND
jgi:hypothetical protein